LKIENSCRALGLTQRRKDAIFMQGVGFFCFYHERHEITRKMIGDE